MNRLDNSVNRQVVLLTAVGNRDPRDERTNEPGPVLEYVKKVRAEEEWQQIRPNQIYLLHTSSRLAEASDLAQELETDETRVKLLSLMTDDPTDFTALLDQMGKHAYDTTLKHSEDVITVLVSPGTSQMNAVWLVLGNEGRLNARFFQKVENRFTEDKRGKIRPVRFEPLFESETIKTAMELLKRYDFDGASRHFKKLGKSANPRRAEIGLFMSSLSEVYAEWDLFNYSEAKKKLLSIQINEKLMGNAAFISLLKNNVRLQGQCLESLSRNDIQTQVLDLLCSADRFRHIKRHTDSLWRCATTYEVMLRRTLSEKHQVSRLRYGFNNYGDVPQMETRLRGDPIIVGRDEIPGVSVPDGGMLRLDSSGVLPKINRVKRDRIDALHFGLASRESGEAVKVTREAVACFFDITEEMIDLHPMSSESLAKVASTATLLFKRHA